MNLSMLDVPISPMQLPIHENYRYFESFMNWCIEYEINEAMYRTCVKNYFKNGSTDEALEMLERESEGGHKAAAYVFALISILLRGETKEHGIETIGQMKGMQQQRILTRECQQSLRQILGKI
ncbi:hypothetical protein EJD97_014089 [Solanum chilense]|uniref:At2g35280-like TPR domain-containing protein n=1 Tax=Solanum chilense TaxID=4083 RepID=A0A6N2BEY1_SOLCI|nr:hypothetical protein EJD97_014089 [Solanum chilense]